VLQAATSGGESSGLIELELSPRVGFVRKFFDRPQVASVVLNAPATIRCGDFIVIRLADRYYGQEIESMQRDRVNIGEAHGGVIGIQTALRRLEVGVGDYVFVRVGQA
jgi:hypothetical protein